MGGFVGGRDRGRLQHLGLRRGDVAHHHGADAAGLRQHRGQRLRHQGTGAERPGQGGHNRGLCGRYLHHVLCFLEEVKLELVELFEMFCGFVMLSIFFLDLYFLLVKIF